MSRHVNRPNVSNGNVLRPKRQQQQIATVTIVLALSTLGGVTKNRNDPVAVVLPKVSLSLALSL